MKKAFLTYFFISLAINAKFSTQKININTQKDLVKECNITISFGSYGSGTPYKIVNKIQKYLEDQNEYIKKTYSWAWGLEGEFTYCLYLKSSKKEELFFNELKTLIPNYSKKGYTTLMTKSGLKHKTTWPKSQ